MSNLYVRERVDVLYSGMLLGGPSKPSTMRWPARRKSFTCSCTRAGALATTTPRTPRRRRRRNVTSYPTSSNSSSCCLVLSPSCRSSKLKTTQVNCRALLVAWWRNGKVSDREVVGSIPCRITIKWLQLKWVTVGG